jgi:hypothetical protein
VPPGSVNDEIEMELANSATRWHLAIASGSAGTVSTRQSRSRLATIGRTFRRRSSLVHRPSMPRFPMPATSM